jgi:hypothetical protein
MLMPIANSLSFHPAMAISLAVAIWHGYLWERRVKGCRCEPHLRREPGNRWPVSSVSYRMSRKISGKVPGRSTGNARKEHQDKLVCIEEAAFVHG